jgi:hypothetical protein
MPAQTQASALTEAEERLKSQFDKERADKQRVPSTARAVPSPRRLDQLILPVNERPMMPLTKDKFIVKENPHLVQWERETRRFLRNLSPRHGHRVAAVMVYEWATGIAVADLVRDGGSASSDLRKINQILLHYFGKPYMTYIAGRKVPKAYRVKPGYYIKRHKPLTLELWVEWGQKTLNP